MKNLRQDDLLTFEKISIPNTLETLTDLIRSAGFYTTKPRRLKELGLFILNNYGSLTKLQNKPIQKIREELLGVYGIGPETADTLILYALDKPSFVVDAYTQKFVKKYVLTDEQNYDSLKIFFESSLPQDVTIYQNCHILIIADQKGIEHCKMEWI